MSKLHEKIARIQGQIGTIAKDGLNKAQGYTFASEQAFLDILRPLTSSEGVSMMISSEMTDYKIIEKGAGKFNHVALCNCTLTLTDAETGEQIVMTSSGVGHDSGDKAIYKAMTGCSKYALWKSFALATGDDVEAHDDGSEDTGRNKPANKSSRGLI